VAGFFVRFFLLWKIDAVDILFQTVRLPFVQRPPTPRSHRPLPLAPIPLFSWIKRPNAHFPDDRSESSRLGLRSQLNAARAIRRAFVWAMLALTLSTAAAAGSKRVLIIHSFGNASPPFTTESIAFETELTKQSKERLDLDEVSLDHARYAAPEMQEALVEYLRKRQAKWQPDLVVPIGSPAAVFVAKYRDRLFPQTPILYTALDQRRLPPEALHKNAALVGTKFDMPGFVEDILQVAPATTNIVVVIGASELEQYWAAAFQKGFEPFTNRVTFTWLNHLPFNQMLERLSKLPPRSFIFMILLLRDAAGVMHNGDDALKRIHDVANAPVNSIFQHQLGLGIMGGCLYQSDIQGAEAARIALRILHGEPATNFSPVIVEALGAQYDWRELQRWKISEARLPRGSLVRFRQPTLWQRHRGWIIAGVSLVIIETLLILGLIVNLVKRRRLEVSVRETEERMTLAANAAGLRLWEWDVATGKVWAAGPLVEKIGPDNAKAAHFTELFQTVHPDDRNGVALALKRSLDGGGDFEHVHRRLLTDGKILWLAARGRVEFDERLKPVRMRGVSMDITARKAAEDQARESEGRFLVMANAAPVLMWAAGPDKLGTFFNQPWLEFTGRTLEQELGYGWAEGLHPDDHDRCLKDYYQAFDSRRPFSIEYRLRRYDGQYRWILDHGIARYDPNQNFAGYIGSCVDVTERRAAEAEAERSRQELAHMGRVSTLGELSGSLAHELNQPLAAIVGNAQAAQRFMNATPPDLEEVGAILEDVFAEGRRAGEVIVQMRSLLKKGEMQMLPLDLNTLIGEVLELMHSELVMRNVTVTTHLAPKLPKVRGDRVQLQQVVLNLVMNACEAMADKPPSRHKLTVKTETLDADEVLVEVSDPGPGFSPEMIERPFETFRTTKPHGLGLGLPICRSIIAAHHGRLWLANNDEGGATVSFALAVDRKVML
jgi:PAS domain S-box-containing protein